jgi:hypothetical protein
VKHLGRAKNLVHGDFKTVYGDDYGSVRRSLVSAVDVAIYDAVPGLVRMAIYGSVSQKATK